MAAPAPESPLQWAVATLKFLLELGALAAVAIWGARTGPLAVNILLGIGAPVVVATIWGLWAAPRAARRLEPQNRLALELAVFLAAGGALVATGFTAAGIAFAAVALVVEGLLFRWGI